MKNILLIATVPCSFVCKYFLATSQAVVKLATHFFTVSLQLREQLASPFKLRLLEYASNQSNHEDDFPNQLGNTSFSLSLVRESL